MNQGHTLFFQILDLQRDPAAGFKMETQRWDTTLLVDTKAYRIDKTVLKFSLIITEISKPRTLKTLSGMKSRKKRRQERIRGSPEILELPCIYSQVSWSCFSYSIRTISFYVLVISFTYQSCECLFIFYVKAKIRIDVQHDSVQHAITKWF